MVLSENHDVCSGLRMPEQLGRNAAGQYRADFVRFLRTARGSVYEVETFALLAESLGFARVPAELTSLLDECIRLINGLIRSCRRDHTGD